MEKKHKPQKSFANDTSLKNPKTGVKKPQEKSHIPAKSNANIDKKPHATILKPSNKPSEKSNKTTITTNKIEEPEKAPVKTEKPVEKKEKLALNNANNSTSIKAHISSQSKLTSSQNESDLIKKIEALKKENNELRKQKQKEEELGNEYLNEAKESQKTSEKYLKEKNDMEVLYKKAQQELKLISQRNDELSKKMEELQEDIEIYKEESETKELEMQVLQKQFDEYKVKAENEIKEAKESSNKTSSETNEKKIEEESKPIIQDNTEDNKENSGKINELEDIINDLSTQLNTVTEQRDYAINYYKAEIEKKNKEVEDFKNQASVIPEKDDLIRQLTEKLKEDEGIVETLKAQIAILSPSVDSIEEIIMEKQELEQKVDELKNENAKLKDEAKENDEAINDLDEALKISEEVVKNSKNDVIVMQNKVEQMEAKVKEYEENQTLLLAKIEDLKNRNKILKEDTSMLKGNSENSKNIWIDYLTSKTIIQNLKRQKIVSDIYNIDNERYLLRNKIIKNMIPKKLLEQGNMVVFDKFLNINSYRKKAFKLIMNQLNNEILTDDLGVNPNKSEDDKIGKVEGEEKKKIISFFELTINTLSEFYSYLFKVEIYLSELTSEQLLKINNENSFNDIYHTIVGGSSIFNTILNLVKTNNFSIQHKSNVDGLKNINAQLKNEVAALENIEDNNLYIYLINILNYFINICCGFKKERIDIIVEDLDVDDKLKSVADSFSDTNKNLDKLITKMEEIFFDNLQYSLGNTILDIENNDFQDMTKKNSQIESALTEKKEYSEKYKSLLSIFNNVYSVMKEAMDKYEPSKTEIPKKSYEDDRILLPVPEWNNITDALYSDLENITKVTQDLEKSRINLEEEKKKFMELKLKYENLEKMKNENDSKLGELIVKVGKFTQIETANEEYTKRIQKYQIAVEGLQTTVNNYEEKEKQYKEKIEILEKKEKEKRHINKENGVDIEKLKLSNGLGDDGKGMNTGELIHTVYLLQKERKNYKNKFMKEKLNKLMEDKDSFVNKYIQKDFRFSRGDNDKEKEKEKTMYKNIHEKVINLNEKYDKIRKKLCLPKVYDLSSKDYDYEKAKKQQEDEIENTRVEYMSDIDNIFVNMFGENINSKTIKDVVNSDVNKNLENFADKKFLVGKIQFNEMIKEDEKSLGSIVYSSKNTIGVPIIIDEEGFKKIHQNFTK